MLGLATKLLDAAKGGVMRRGRDVLQLDIGYPGSSLALAQPQRESVLRAGERAPDAPIQGRARQPTRLFELFKGPHWTLLGHGVERELVHPRPGLHIHTFGLRGDGIDAEGHLRAAYGLGEGDWVLVRPDGYVGALVASDQLDVLARYLDAVGLGVEA
jgi:hypothetical protein